MTPSQPPPWIHAMQSAAFYPHPVESVSMKETHISWVFLTGEVVYKVKKPVDLGFLDFTTLALREKSCRHEVDLNRRLTTGVYLDVAPITQTGDDVQLDGDGEVVDVAVKMRQLADEHSMQRVLDDQGALDETAIDRLAAKLARFYAAAAGGADIDRRATPEAIAKNCRDNFRRIADIPDNAVDERLLRIVASATEGFLDRQQRLFLERMHAGRIREGHGDLRCDHVYLTDGAIQIIDCIEFNRWLRCGDVANDLAFLAMSMDFHGHPSTAGRLMTACARHADDNRMFALLDFYKCYRAMVRVKVDGLRLNQPDLDDEDRGPLRRRIDRYLGLAYRYARHFSRPTLWVVGGQIATGKSTVARALADTLHLAAIRSDVERKRRFADRDRQPGVTAVGEGIYSPDVTALTYARLLRRAGSQLREGRSTILDATFSRRAQRREARRLARTTGARMVLVECVCRQATIRQRLARRERESPVSDARIDHLAALQAAYEPPDRRCSNLHIRIDTEGSLAASLSTILGRWTTLRAATLPIDHSGDSDGMK